MSLCEVWQQAQQWQPRLLSKPRVSPSRISTEVYPRVPYIQLRITTAPVSGPLVSPYNSLEPGRSNFVSNSRTLNGAQDLAASLSCCIYTLLLSGQAYLLWDTSCISFYWPRFWDNEGTCIELRYFEYVASLEQGCSGCWLVTLPCFIFSEMKDIS
jgi:hypothetical protein